MWFLVDAQLPPALARWLTSVGHHAEHVGDIELLSATDLLIWRFALEENGVIVTKDEDFAGRKTLAPVGPRNVWVRLRNSRRRERLVWFEGVLPQLIEALERGEELVEIA